MNLREALAQVAARLEGETARFEAQVLLASLLQRSRTWIAAHPEAELTRSQLDSIEQAVSRLLAGEPLPYVLGRWEFFGLEFELSHHVLIPRPETELLVEHAISWLKAHPGQRSMLEVGTGSGCIAVAIAKHVKNVVCIASDISFEALVLARNNARRHAVGERIAFLQADLLSAFAHTGSLDRKFNLICSNPPYIPSEVLHSLQVFGREPMQALDGGTQGLAVISRLLQECANWLDKPGLFMVEIESSHGEAARSTAKGFFKGAEVHVLKDLAGHDRLLRIER